MTLVIRRACLQDAAALSDFAQRSFREAFARDNSPQDMDAYVREHFTPKRQAREIMAVDAQVLLAQGEGGLLAYALLDFGPPATCVNTRGAAGIGRFYVDRTMHGRGVAKRLLRAVEDCTAQRGARGLWLQVWEHNARARAFYVREGFRAVGQAAFLLGADVQNDLVLYRDPPPPTHRQAAS